MERPVLAAVALALAALIVSAAGLAALYSKTAGVEERQGQLAETTGRLADALGNVTETLVNVTDALASVQAALEAQSGAVGDLRSVVESLSTALEDLRERLTELQASVGEVNETAAERLSWLAERIAEVEERLSAISAGSNASIAELREAVEEIRRALSEVEEVLYYPVTVVDGTGDQVTLASRPERIVSLAPSVTEILWAVGAGGQVVGVDSYSNYPPEVAEMVENGTLATVGGPWTPDVEAILSLQPDLVVGVASIGAQVKVKEVLSKYGIPVVLLPNRDLGDVYESIITVGLLTGHRAEAARLASQVKAAVASVKAVVDGYLAQTGAGRVSVAIAVWVNPLYVVGNGTWMHDLITLAGGVNAFGGLAGWPMVSPEDLLAADPDVIVVTSGKGALTYEDVLAYLEEDLGDAVYNLTAYAAGRIYVVSGDYEDALVRPGPRVAQALQLLAAILYPQAFNLEPGELPHTLTPETFPLPQP